MLANTRKLPCRGKPPSSKSLFKFSCLWQEGKAQEKRGKRGYLNRDGRPTGCVCISCRHTGEADAQAASTTQSEASGDLWVKLICTTPQGR